MLPMNTDMSVFMATHACVRDDILLLFGRVSVYGTTCVSVHGASRPNNCCNSDVSPHGQSVSMAPYDTWVQQAYARIESPDGY